MTASTAPSSSGMRSGGTKPGEDERAADAQPLEVGDQAVAEDAVADPDEPDLRVGREHLGGDGDDVVVPLELEEPRDRGEGDLVVGQPQLAPDVLARTREDSGTRRRPCRCRRSGTARAVRRRRRGPASVIASQTLTIA